jgi:hypothetical protein
VVVWGDSKIFVINRKEKDGAVTGFDCKANACKQNLSIQLLPYFHIEHFPFAFVLSQSQLLIADLRRLQAFAISAWSFKGAPHNNHQFDSFLSIEPGSTTEGINLVLLEFDGSNSFVRRLFFSPDFVQAIKFLG